jgi:hypothetical protein
MWIAALDFSSMDWILVTIWTPPPQLLLLLLATKETRMQRSPQPLALLLRRLLSRAPLRLPSLLVCLPNNFAMVPCDVDRLRKALLPLLLLPHPPRSRCWTPPWLL